MFNKLSKKKCLVLLIIFLVIILLVYIFSTYPKDRPVNYFPSEQMVKTFKGNLNNDEFVQIVDRIEDGKIQIKQIDTYTKVAMVYDISKDFIRLVYSLEEINEFKDDYIRDLKENRHDIIIKTPLTIGTSWRDDIGGVSRIVEVGSITVTPAGKFESLIIEYKNDQFNVREYYAKDIGLVKIIINNYLVNELVNLEKEVRGVTNED